MTPRALLRHFVLGSAHLPVAAQALLMIGTQQGWYTALGLLAYRMTGSAGGHGCLFFHWAQVMTPCTDCCLINVKITCQAASIGNFRKLLDNSLMGELGRSVLIFKYGYLHFLFGVIRYQLLGCRELFNSIEALKGAIVTGCTG